MNIDNNLILIKGEDKTASVTSWRFDKYKPVVFITFNGKKEYPYNTADVQFLKETERIIVENKIVLRNGAEVKNVYALQYFHHYFTQYCRIYYTYGSIEFVKYSDFKIVDSALNDALSNRIFEYLKQIANRTGLVVEGRNILANSYEKIDFVREDSALAAFLSGKYEKKHIEKNIPIVYPFGFNLSQKKAVDNALCNPISIIEGPPGTGKTQTILNIIANAVMRGESVAVVSSNNSATANVLEKLKKYGVDFIAAPLGSSSNRKAFIESQNPNLPDMRAWREVTDDLSTLRQDEVELDKMLSLQSELSAITAEYDALKNEYAHFDKYYQTLHAEFPRPEFDKHIGAFKILEYMAEHEQLLERVDKLSFWRRFWWRIKYGIRKSTAANLFSSEYFAHCQMEYYMRYLDELERKLTKIKKELSQYDFDAKMKRYSAMSMTAFKASLAKKYGVVRTRAYYEASDLWKNSETFINDYPVVLSTTYSLRASLSSSFVYDYVIVDEASQVDLATGALALSCAKKNGYSR